MQQNQYPSITINNKPGEYLTPDPKIPDNQPEFLESDRESYKEQLNSIRSNNGDDGIMPPDFEKNDRVDDNNLNFHAPGQTEPHPDEANLLDFDFQKKIDPEVEENLSANPSPRGETFLTPTKNPSQNIPSVNFDELEKQQKKKQGNEGGHLINRNYTVNNFATGSKRSILKTPVSSHYSIQDEDEEGNARIRKVKFAPNDELKKVKEIDKAEYEGPQEWTLLPMRRDELEIEEDRLKDEYFKKDNTTEVNKYRADILMNMYFSKKPDQNPETDPYLNREQKNDLKQDQQEFIEKFSNKLFCKFSDILSEKHLTFKNYIRFRDKYRPLSLKMDKIYKVTKFGRNNIFNGDIRFISFTHHGRHFAWSATHGGEPRKEYAVQFFNEVKKGKQTPTINKFKKTEENKCLSIIMKTRTIDMECESEEDRDDLAYKLEKLLEVRQCLNNDDDVIVYASNYAAIDNQIISKSTPQLQTQITHHQIDHGTKKKLQDCFLQTGNTTNRQIPGSTYLKCQEIEIPI